MNNRIRIARTGPATYIGNADESLKLQAGQPFYDIHTNRLYIANQNDKKIRELVNSNGITAYQADRFVTPRSLKTKLDSTAAITFDGSANQDAIPVTGVLSVANGGTGVSDSTTESNITVKNVKSQINSKNISDIFNDDGLTVKRANYDVVISNQAEFNSFYNSIRNNTFNAVSVLLKDGSYSISDGIGIKLPNTLLQLHGIGNVNIKVTNFVRSDNNKAAIWSDNLNNKLLSIDNINVECVASHTSPAVCFYGCDNISNSDIKISVKSINGSRSNANYQQLTTCAFSYCNNIVNCNITCSYEYDANYSDLYTGLLYKCDKVSNVTIEQSMDDFGESISDTLYVEMVYSCTNLNNVKLHHSGKLPSKSTGFYDWAILTGFYDCTNLIQCMFSLDWKYTSDIDNSGLLDGNMGQVIAFHTCNNLNCCNSSIGPIPDGGAMQAGFYYCNNLSSCTSKIDFGAIDFGKNTGGYKYCFESCNNITSSTATLNYHNPNNINSVPVHGGAGFSVCDQVAGCQAECNIRTGECFDCVCIAACLAKVANGATGFSSGYISNDSCRTIDWN